MGQEWVLPMLNITKEDDNKTDSNLKVKLGIYRHSRHVILVKLISKLIMVNNPILYYLYFPYCKSYFNQFIVS